MINCEVISHNALWQPLIIGHSVGNWKEFSLFRRLALLPDLIWDSNLCWDEESFHVKWHGPQNPAAVCQAGEHSVQQSALVRVMAAASGNTSGLRGRVGGWLRRKYQLPIVQLVTFSVILLPLRRETHRAAGRWWNNAALLKNTPHFYSESSAVKYRRAAKVCEY